MASPYINGANLDTSNWLRFIKTPPRDQNDNVEGHVYFGKVFYRTKKDLHPGQELYVYRGDMYNYDYY